jgi:hypothetical protein
MIPFAPWLPDTAAFETGSSREALNVIPSLSGFRPFPAFANIASAITGAVRGAVSVRALNGTIFNFCGDGTKLYRLNTNGLAWTDVSRVTGGAYSTAADGRWTFAQFGDFLIAANGTDAPQVFNMASATNFSNLGGSPPQSAFAGTIREFGILAKNATANNRIRWSAIGNIADWIASATTLSDYQDFPEGGSIMGFVGGEYGVVFQERAIQRMSFEGPPTVFRFDKITNFLGCRAEGSIASYENLIFFLSDDGFYMLRGGAELVPIGSEKVDRWLEGNIDSSYLYRISAAIDPINKLYVVGFASNTGNGVADQLLVYNWISGQWSRVSQQHQLVYTAATQATYTIDGMNAVSATIDGLPFPMDSRFWAGSGRLLLSAFDTSNRQGMFTGLPLAATIETGDFQLAPGRRSLFRALKPLVEGQDVVPSMVVGKRNSLSQSVTYGVSVPANAYGVCDARVNGRYHRARISIPANSQWQFARGIDDVKFSSMGER